MYMYTSYALLYYVYFVYVVGAVYVHQYFCGFACVLKVLYSDHNYAIHVKVSFCPWGGSTFLYNPKFPRDFFLCAIISILNVPICNEKCPPHSRRSPLPPTPVPLTSRNGSHAIYVTFPPCGDGEILNAENHFICVLDQEMFRYIY